MEPSTLSVTVQVENMTKVHNKVMHGIRSTFMANKLQAIEYLRSASNYKLTKYTDDGGIAAYLQVLLTVLTFPLLRGSCIFLAGSFNSLMN